MAEFLQGVLPGIVLPPFLLVFLSALGGLLAWRGRRGAGLLVALCAVAILLLATPFVAGWLVASLEARIAPPPAVGGSAPGAIVILAAEAARASDRAEPGALTLERIRAGARLHRRTGLPVLVTGGAARRGDPSLGQIMADSLREDFGIAARWVEGRSRDTRENATFSAEMLRAEGIGAVWVVTHGWHLGRAQRAFGRAGLVAHPAPVRLDRVPDPDATAWMPRPDHLARSWFALREWVGELAYALRDGPAR